MLRFQVVVAAGVSVFLLVDDDPYCDVVGGEGSDGEQVEDLMEPEDRKKENVVIYEDGAVEFYINVYKTAKSYNEKVLKVTDEKFIKIFLEQNLKDGGYLFSKADGEPYTQYSFNVISARHSIDKLGETKIMKILVKHYLDDNNFKRLNELQSSRGSSLTTILKSYNLYNT